MKTLYPFLMVPEFDPRPWGTLDLAPIYPNQRFAQKIGEAWLTGDHCKIANGPLAGRRLDEISRQLGRELVGDAARDAQRFPLLLKFLFPHEKLSVQVHPDDMAAQHLGEPWGKTECWYIAHAQAGSQIGLGLKPGVTRAQFALAIHEQRAEELLNWLDVHSGDMIYVAAGTVHTLGPGSILVETQQQSDATYRLYDYGRPRELHLERGLAAIKETAASGKVLRRPLALNGAGNKDSQGGGEELVAGPYFVVDKYELSADRQFSTADAGDPASVQILVAVEGSAAVECEGCPTVTFAKGDAVVVPASANEFQVHPQNKIEFLISRVPGKPRPEPVTQH
jgi:mannose-6-phosphate isomerase